MPVYFLKTVSNKEKIDWIEKVIERHFYKKEPLLIQVQDEQVANYLDDLLWKISKESFYPHTICESNSQDIIVITWLPRNFNQAVALLNLSLKIPISYKEFEYLYEFMDLTDKNKQAISKEKKEKYESMGLKVDLIEDRFSL